MKHKHCEVIKAWADGKTVQFFCEPDGKWHDLSTPNFHTYHDYRVKPETVRYRVALMSYGSRNWTISVDSVPIELITSRAMEFSRWLGDWQEVEV